MYPELKKSLVLGGILLLIAGGLLAWRFGWAPQIGKFFAAEPSQEKLVLADFYWWYPWYGMQWRDASFSWQAPVNEAGYVRQDAFPFTFATPIPYLKSSERPNGVDDSTGNIGTSWFKNNFSRAAGAGIDVMTPMMRPDLPMWPATLAQMIRAQKELRAEGRPYPKLLLHFDGIEYWDGVGDNSQFTGPGTDFDAVWNGVKTTFDTIFSNITPEEVSAYFYTYPDTNTFPVLSYRIEGGWSNITTSDWWLAQLKINFNQTYPGKTLFVVLDDLFCNQAYGVGNSIVTATCNANNYYYWGGALDGARLPQYRKPGLTVITVGPGFDNRKIMSPGAMRERADGQWLSSQFNLATSLGANWVVLETFNFGEEGTVIDDTIGANGYGNFYLNLTRTLITQWKGAAPPKVTINAIPTTLTGQALGTISGTATDAIGVTKVRVVIRYKPAASGACTADSRDWDGTTWVTGCQVAGQIVPTITLGTSVTWSVANTPPLAQMNPGAYRIFAAAYRSETPLVWSTWATFVDTTYQAGPLTTIPGDANDDGHVNILDFNLVASHFGQSGSSISGDVNHDDKVNILDFNLVISHFGQ